MAEDVFDLAVEPEEDAVEETVAEPAPEAPSEDATVSVRLASDFDAGSQVTEEGEEVQNERVAQVSTPGFPDVELTDNPTYLEPRHAAALVESRVAEVAE
jgi:hypothetical protein